MLCTCREIHEEGLVGGYLLGVGDERDRVVSEVLGQVVSLFGSLWWLRPMVVMRQVRVVLVGVPAHEAIEPFEAATQRPPVVRAGRRRLVRGGEVPFPDCIGVVTLGEEDLGQKTVLERNVAVIPGE